jgi:hypothetical protein
MESLTVMRARLEAQPDREEKRGRLESLNTIAGQLPVKEWQNKGAHFWGELN